MPVLRRGPSAPQASATRVLLTDTSPYRSRTLTVETDGTTTVAYLRDARDDVIGAVWIANHRAAEPGVDMARLDAGLPPVMHSDGTRHPGGLPMLDPAALEVVWFEEGDGAAVLQDGEPICVIPVWSEINRGIPGYSRDATTRTPFAFPLHDEIEELGTRIRQAQAYWDWRAGENAWPAFQQSLLGHLLDRLGPGGHYWHDVGRQWRGGTAPAPTVGVSERPPQPGRDYTVLSTVGMSCQRMPTVELYEDDVSPLTRIELAVATTLPSQRAGSVFPWLAQYPWRSVTWFAPGDVVKWYHEPRTFPLNGSAAAAGATPAGASGPPPSQWEGVLLLDEPSRLAGPVAPGLSGWSFGGDPVKWLWLVPITDEERQYAKAQGSDALVRRLAQQGRSWVVGP
jgi:hypothetical protein